MDEVLVSGIARNVNSMNAAGCDHLKLNARVLFHNLLNVEPTSDLSRTFAFLQAFQQGPAAVSALVKSTSPYFSRDEVKQFLKLAFSEDIEGPDRELATRAQRNLETRLAQLG